VITGLRCPHDNTCGFEAGADPGGEVVRARSVTVDADGVGLERTTEPSIATTVLSLTIRGPHARHGGGIVDRPIRACAAGRQRAVGSLARSANTSRATRRARGPPARQNLRSRAGRTGSASCRTRRPRAAIAAAASALRTRHVEQRAVRLHVLDRPRPRRGNPATAAIW
jgi:hypothetical protein